MSLGHAGYRSRPAKDDDPLVCGCGATIGTVALNKPENKDHLKRVLGEHEAEHKRRLAHQVHHATTSGKCERCGGNETQKSP